MYIPRSKSVLLERLLDYTDILRSKRELHQSGLMKYMDIPCSQSVLHEKGLIYRRVYLFVEGRGSRVEGRGSRVPCRGRGFHVEGRG